MIYNNLYLYSISPDVTAFSTTRHGGVSKGNYGEFNVNAYCGDDAQAVYANRKALEDELGISGDGLLMPHQVHQTRNLFVSEDFLSLPAASRLPLLEGVDSLTTDVKGVCIGVSTADCIPVVLYDPAHRASAAVHAGWRGTVKRIVASTLQAMVKEYGTNPSDVIAVVGPGISLKNFEVGDEVYDAFAKAGFDMSLIAEHYEKWHINLPLCNQLQLEEAGVLRKSILQCGICTYDHVADYFSARRLGQQSGRIFTGIILR